MKASPKAAVVLVHKDPNLGHKYVEAAQDFLEYAYDYYGHSTGAANYVADGMNRAFGNHWFVFLGPNGEFYYNWYQYYWDDSMGFDVNVRYHAEVFRT